MIHIIWRGKGYLAAITIFGSSLFANLITNQVTGSEAYWDAHPWTLAVSLVVSGVVCWFLGTWLEGRPGQVVIDKKTGKELILNGSHELFFIRVKFWAPILILIAAFITAKEFFF